MPQKLQADKWLFSATAGLALFGVVMVYSASAVIALQENHSQFFYVVKQGVWTLFGFVVMFIATKCPYSNAYNDRMRQMAEDYAKKDVLFVGVNSNKTEPAEEVLAHAKEHRFGFPLMKDPGNKVADLYDARHTPEVYVVDPSGKLRYHGRIDENYENPEKVTSPDLKNALEALLAGQAVAKAETKAFGCSIKRA